MAHLILYQPFVGVTTPRTTPPPQKASPGPVWVLLKMFVWPSSLLDEYGYSLLEVYYSDRSAESSFVIVSCQLCCLPLKIFSWPWLHIIACKWLFNSVCSRQLFHEELAGSTSGIVKGGLGRA